MAAPTLFETAFSPSESSPLSHEFPPSLYTLIHTCSAWPFAWRKFALTVCRVQVDPLCNTRLLQEIEEIKSSTFEVPIISPYNGARYYFDDIIRQLSIISTSPILCSIMSYVTRAENLQTVYEYEAQTTKTILKELHAATSPNTPQKLDYTALTSPSPFLTLFPRFDTWNPNGAETLKAWQRGVSRLSNIFSTQEHIKPPPPGTMRSLQTKVLNNNLSQL